MEGRAGSWEASCGQCDAAPATRVRAPKARRGRPVRSRGVPTHSPVQTVRSHSPRIQSHLLALRHRREADVPPLRARAGVRVRACACGCAVCDNVAGTRRMRTRRWRATLIYGRWAMPTASRPLAPRVGNTQRTSCAVTMGARRALVRAGGRSDFVRAGGPHTRQPTLMTRPPPTGNVKGVPRVTDESNVSPLDASLPV